jgi:AcrR family transcriptional regulator
MSTQPRTMRRQAAVSSPSRRAAGKARVRGELLGAARRLFAAQGVVETTMDDIARAAAVSRATAFNYFPSKAQLLQALALEMEERFLARIEQQLAEPASAAERISQLFQWTAGSIEGTPELSRVLIVASEAAYGRDRETALRTARMHEAFCRLLQAGRRAGDVRRDVGIEALAEVVGGTYIGVLHAWRVAGKYPLRRRMSEVASVLGELVGTQDATTPRETQRRRR